MGVRAVAIGAVSFGVVADYLTGSHVAAVAAGIGYVATIHQFVEVMQDLGKAIIKSQPERGSIDRNQRQEREPS